MPSNTRGRPAMLTAPSTPMAMNQTSITGPKKRPTRPVPRCWIAKSANVIIKVRGMTAMPKRSSASVETLDRREDRNRRRDDRIAVEQRCRQQRAKGYGRQQARSGREPDGSMPVARRSRPRPGCRRAS